MKLSVAVTRATGFETLSAKSATSLGDAAGAACLVDYKNALSSLDRGQKSFPGKRL